MRPLTGQVVPEVVCSTANREDHGSNPTMALGESLWAQEMNLWIPLDQGVNWYPMRVVSVQV